MVTAESLFQTEVQNRRIVLPGDFISLFRELVVPDRSGTPLWLTNGCFDPLETHHQFLFRHIRQQAPKNVFLVVLLNSDASILAYKQRPARRPECLRALSVLWQPAVSLVVLFDEPSPAALVEQIRPDRWYRAEPKSEEERQAESGVPVERTYGPALSWSGTLLSSSQWCTHG